MDVMERRARKVYEAAAYPTPGPSRRRVLAGLGSVAGLAALSALTKGCLPPENGGGGTFSVTLPIDEDSRTVYIDYGSIDYHVLLQLTDEDLHDYIEDEADALGALVDELLGSHAITDFAPAEELSAVETAIAQLIADDYNGVTGSDLDAFSVVFLSIDHYDEGEEIAGMEG